MSLRVIAAGAAALSLTAVSLLPSVAVAAPESASRAAKAKLHVKPPASTSVVRGSWKTIKVKVTNRAGGRGKAIRLLVDPPRGVKVKSSKIKVGVLARGKSKVVKVKVKATSKARKRSTVKLRATGTRVRPDRAKLRLKIVPKASTQPGRYTGKLYDTGDNVSDPQQGAKLTFSVSADGRTLKGFTSIPYVWCYDPMPTPVVRPIHAPNFPISSTGRIDKTIKVRTGVAGGTIEEKYTIRATISRGKVVNGYFNYSADVVAGIPEDWQSGCTFDDTLWYAQRG